MGGGGEGGDGEGELEKGVAVCVEGGGRRGDGGGWRVFEVGDEVIWGAGGVGGGVGGEGVGCETEVVLGGGEDTVVVDGGDVRAGGRAGGMEILCAEDLGVEEARGRKGGGGGAELAARKGHDGALGKG